MLRIVVVGAGGQGRETACVIEDLAAAGEEVSFAGFVVTDLSRLGPRDSRERVLGDTEWLQRNRKSFDALALGIGTPAARLAVSALLLAEYDESHWPALIHPTAVYDKRTCTFAAGSSAAQGAVMTVNVSLAPFALANFGCTIGHEAKIGRGSVVNPGANVSGGVTIGDGVLVGTGAQVLQYLSVADGATIGAGAVVTRNVEPGTTVLGAPARPRGVS